MERMKQIRQVVVFILTNILNKNENIIQNFF